MQGFAGWIFKHALGIVLAALLLGGVGGYYSVLLYRNLRPDLQELLPRESRSVRDLTEISERLRSIDSLAVLILTEDGPAGRRFVDDLVERLEKLPRTVSAGVEYRITEAIEYFQRHQALYIDLKDLEKIRKYVQDRIQYEKEIRNPLNIFSETEIPQPDLNFLALRQKYSGKVSAYTRFPDGYYATPDGKQRAVLVYAPGNAAEIEVLKRLKQAVADAVAELDPQRYAPDLQVRYSGGVENMIEEQAALIADLELSTVIVAVLVTLAMLIYFRSMRATFALVTSLFIGTLITFGVSFFAVGYLNANSAFLGSIVIGNGINFGIIPLARYLEERRKGLAPVDASAISIRETATSTWTAALAAGLSYGSLILTNFRGFRQFGVIGLIGMVLCWVSAFTVLPALLALLDRRSRPVSVASVSGDRGANAFVRMIQHYRRPILVASTAVTVVAWLGLTRFSPDILEADLERLRSKESFESGSAHYSKILDQIFGRYLSPIALLAHSPAQAEEIAKKLRAIKEAQGASSLIAQVETLQNFLPKDQARKLRKLEEIRTLLPERLVRQLSPADQKLVAEFLQPGLRPVTLTALPRLVRDKLSEKDGRLGNLVLVEPPLGREIRERENLYRFVDTLRNVADSVAPGIPVAGALPISSDTLKSISRDGPRATLFAFLGVVVLVIALFRDRKIVSSVLFALFLGVSWMIGAILWLGIKINFLNFVALPITFGIGVDYGVNIFQRYRLSRAGGISPVIRETGGAVALASLTTIIGYGSLLLAQNQAFNSFGYLAVLGELTCMLAALISLPAYLLEREHRQRLRELNEKQAA